MKPPDNLQATACTAKVEGVQRQEFRSFRRKKKTARFSAGCFLCAQCTRKVAPECVTQEQATPVLFSALASQLKREKLPSFARGIEAMHAFLDE